MIKALDKRDTYRDSVNLMLLNSLLLQIEDIKQAAVVMGTEANKKRILDLGLNSNLIEVASANDLCIVVSSDNEKNLDEALTRAEDFIEGKWQNEDYDFEVVRNIHEALEIQPNSNLAVISVPGEYAVEVTRTALEKDLNVFLFSDNVSLQDEVMLKREALEKKLIIMGPDCGTALIQGTPLGFVNKVKKGNIGIVGASGTGIQHVMTLIDKFGSGISQIIGTGGNDLSEEVGGITCLQGLELLENNESTKVIVVIAKPGDPNVQQKVIERASKIGKKVIIHFIGADRVASTESVIFCDSLMHTALTAVAIDNSQALPIDINIDYVRSKYFNESLQKQIQSKNPSQKFVRGIFCGGTLADEAAVILSLYYEEVFVIKPFAKLKQINDYTALSKHCILDLGDDIFTQGKPHPMLDLSEVARQIEAQKEDPTVSVIIFDVVLGYGSNPDPAGILQKVIKSSVNIAAQEGRQLSFIASITGTQEDIQGYEEQKKKLTDVGVLICDSNAEAANLAVLITEVFN